MGEPLMVVLLLAVLAVPAVIVARSARRLGRTARRVERLSLWAEPRGWRVLGADLTMIGRWQCPPFTASERDVRDGLVGEHRGRQATSLRLVADGEVFHALTVELRRVLPVTQVMTAGEPAPELGAGGDRLAERAPEGWSMRLERGVLVGWLPGEPLLALLEDYLDLLADVAERFESLDTTT